MWVCKEGDRIVPWIASSGSTLAVMKEQRNMKCKDLKDGSCYCLLRRPSESTAPPAGRLPAFARSRGTCRR